MKIVILLRYPLIERSAWKRKLIDGLIRDGHDVALLFGGKGIPTQIKAVIKEYGTGIFRKTKEQMSKGSSNLNLSRHYQKRLPVWKIRNLNGAKSEKLIAAYRPDLVLLLGSGIIRENILSISGVRFIHCHHGFLPLFRGVNTAEWNVFFKNEAYLTTHFVDPGIDTGRIILREKIDLKEVHTIKELRLKCRDECVPVILKTVDLLKNGFTDFIEQERKDGRQYFAMHPVLRNIVEKKLASDVRKD